MRCADGHQDGSNLVFGLLLHDAEAGRVGGKPLGYGAGRRHRISRDELAASRNGTQTEGLITVDHHPLRSVRNRFQLPGEIRTVLIAGGVVRKLRHPQVAVDRIGTLALEVRLDNVANTLEFEIG